MEALIIEAQFDDRQAVAGINRMDAGLNTLVKTGERFNAGLTRTDQVLQQHILLTDGWRNNISATERAVTSATTATTKATSATKSLSAQLATLGQTAQRVASIFGVGLSAGALVALTYSTAHAASAIIDLSQQLDVSIDYAQRLQIAATRTGTSIDTFGRSMFALQNNLAEGSMQTEAALRVLGLTSKQLQAMSQQDQIDTVTRRLAAFTDVQTRNRVGSDLLGLSYQELAKNITELPGLIDSATTASSQAVMNIDATAKRVAETNARAMQNLIELEDAAISGAKRLDRLLYGERTKALEAASNVLPTLPSVSIVPAGPPVVSLNTDRVIASLDKDIQKLNAAAEKTQHAMEEMFEPIRQAARDKLVKEIEAFRNPILTLARATATADEAMTSFFDTIQTRPGATETIGFLPGVSSDQLARDFAAIEKFYKDLPPAVNETARWSNHLSDVADEFQRIAIISDGSMSKVSRTVGTTISAVSQLQQTIQSLGSATSMTGAGALDTFMQIATAILNISSALRQVFPKSAEFRTMEYRAQDFEHEVNAAFGSVERLHAELLALGADGAHVWDQIMSPRHKDHEIREFMELARQMIDDAAAARISLADTIREASFEADQAGRSGIDAVLASLDHQREAELRGLHQLSGADAALYQQAVDAVTRKYTALADRAIKDEADRMASQTQSQVDELTRISGLLDGIKRHTDTEIAGLGAFSSAGSFYEAVIARIQGRQSAADLAQLKRASDTVAPAGWNTAPIVNTSIQSINITSALDDPQIGSRIGAEIMAQVRRRGNRIN